MLRVPFGRRDDRAPPLPPRARTKHISPTQRRSFMRPRVLIAAMAVSVLLAIPTGNARAASVLLSGTVTCDLVGSDTFTVTGGTFSLAANGVFTFKMTGLEPNDAYSCILECRQGVGIVFENCGTTNSVGKTATSQSGFFVPPPSLCTGPVISFTFDSGAFCISGYGTGAGGD